MSDNLENQIADLESPESDESTSSGISQSSAGSTSNLSILVLFDDFIRVIKQRHYRYKNVQGAFLHMLEETKSILQKYGEISSENEKLGKLIDQKALEISDIEIRLNRARHILDEEKKKSKKVFLENEALKDKLNQVADFILGNDHVKISEEVKEKLSFLNVEHDYDNRKGRNLSAIQEINSTGSLLSDFSVSRSEDDLELSKPLITGREWKKHKPSADVDLEPIPKKRRSSCSKVVEIGATDTIKATTTLVVENKGPITATSIIESIPQTKHGLIPTDEMDSPLPSAPPPHLVFESWNQNNSPQKFSSNTLRPETRYHSLQQKTVIASDNCVVCHKKISFGKTAVKCKECRILAHLECKTILPLPCIPVINTPNHKKILGIISDYAPTTPPMVPALIIHCINEIELRGLNELGLYRISAAEKDVKSLQEKFLKGRSVSNLGQIDLHVICGCVKDFLRSLTQPITTYSLRSEFVRAIEKQDRSDVGFALRQCISKLPLANRDTLAYLILHLQKVSQSPNCKMPIENLAKIFGPTIVGYSSDNPNPNNLLTETKQQIMIMEQLIRLPSEYWSAMLNVVSEYPGRKLQQTPSTDSLLKTDAQMFTPRSKRNIKRKIFATPPAFKY